MKTQRYVFMLGLGMFWGGEWHYTGWDQPFATLEAAQASILGVSWVKDERKSVWRTAEHDVIKRLALLHAPKVSKRRQADAKKAEQ